MEIPGVDSILYTSAREVWHDEHSPASEPVRRFDAIRRKVETEQFDQAMASLHQIPLADLQRSEHMRWRYLRGKAYRGLDLWQDAFTNIEEALRIATDAHDLRSVIVLAIEAGDALYDGKRTEDALTYYEIALDAWRQLSAGVTHPRAEPEVTLMTNLSRQFWMLGRFEEAHNKLAPALTLVTSARGVRHSNELDRMTANGLWMLGLIHRSRSDDRDGDGGYLHDAIKRMRKAEIVKKRIGTPDYLLARLYIQIAELYLDLAEVHQHYGVADSARRVYDSAFNYATKASEFLAPTRDEAAKLLARLTLLRHAIMRLSRPERALPNELQQIELALSEIEYEGANIKDKFVLAKAATLRGEWLLLLGNPEKARESLLWAIDGFQTEGKGMATRTNRLLRRITNEPPPGGRWRPSGGPMPILLKDLDLDDDALN